MRASNKNGTIEIFKEEKEELLRKTTKIIQIHFSHTLTLTHTHSYTHTHTLIRTQLSHIDMHQYTQILLHLGVLEVHLNDHWCLLGVLRTHPEGIPSQKGKNSLLNSKIFGYFAPNSPIFNEIFCFSS